jgi:sulfur relay (sulfurtransferase) complex TusBCD TusD component (DsrE family)
MKYYPLQHSQKQRVQKHVTIPICVQCSNGEGTRINQLPLQDTPHVQYDFAGSTKWLHT